jgi:hypothetical protein
MLLDTVSKPGKFGERSIACSLFEWYTNKDPKMRIRTESKPLSYP